mmetsp:Transcript_39139/g.76514  ORF Transcript_39139/g.76514 Transcript_39139/m.76514 type:complete len:204 (+) Transcript_39139:208-819(+)
MLDCSHCTVWLGHWDAGCVAFWGGGLLEVACVDSAEDQDAERGSEETRRGSSCERRRMLGQVHSTKPSIWRGVHVVLRCGFGKESGGVYVSPRAQARVIQDTVCCGITRMASGKWLAEIPALGRFRCNVTLIALPLGVDTVWRIFGHCSGRFRLGGCEWERVGGCGKGPLFGCHAERRGVARGYCGCCGTAGRTRRCVRVGAR